MRVADQSVFVGKKERRRFTLNRDFGGDYLNLLNNPALRSLIGNLEILATIPHDNSIFYMQERTRLSNFVPRSSNMTAR
jgi:hypothetical protein